MDTTENFSTEYEEGSVLTSVVSKTFLCLMSDVVFREKSLAILTHLKVYCRSWHFLAGSPTYEEFTIVFSIIRVKIDHTSFSNRFDNFKTFEISFWLNRKLVHLFYVFMLILQVTYEFGLRRLAVHVVRFSI